MYKIFNFIFSIFINKENHIKYQIKETKKKLSKINFFIYKILFT